MAIHGEATVTDVNRQRWTSSTHLLVHPATHYVGLRSLTSFVPRGESIAVDAVITDLDGQRIAGQPIEMVAQRLAWTKKKGKWLEEVADKQTCILVSASEPKPADSRQMRAVATG